MKKNLIKKIFPVILIPAAGFILLNLTFLFYFLLDTVMNRLFVYDFNPSMRWIPVIKHILSSAVIVVLSWLVLRSKLNELFKAIFSTVPAAVILVILGMLFSPWPAAAYGICALFYAAAIFYLYMTKKSWMFYYAVSLVALALLVMRISGMDI